MKFIIYLVTSALAVMVSAYVLPGVRVDSFFTAIVVGVILGMANMILKPILVILTLPITILTLGLFTLCINGAIVLLVARIVPGFYVDGLLWGIIFSLLMSFVSSFFNWISRD
jgi:putative membrane protein